MSDDAFYVPDGDHFVAAAWTLGPWSPTAQHAGPPSALAARAIEALPCAVPMRVTRFTLEILRAIPVGPIRVAARILRDGKRVQHAEATLEADGEIVAVARAWRIRSSATPVVAEHNDATQLTLPDACPGFELPGMPERSYLKAMELRVAHGRPFQQPSAAWFRMRYPLVAGEKPTPLQRIMIAADSGNGISALLDFSHVFINVELSVHLLRYPEGEWVALDAQTRIDPAGIGVADSVLYDERGRLGNGSQSLYIDGPASR